MLWPESCGPTSETTGTRASGGSCYTASHDDASEALAVFAVPRDRYAPDAVRVAIVDETSGATLYRPEPAPT